MAAGLRVYLLLYALVVAAAPIAALVLQSEQDLREDRQALEAAVVQDVQTAATVQQRAVADVQAAMELLVTLPAVGEPQPRVCGDLLDAASGARRDLQALWRIDPDDRVLCSSRELLGDLSGWAPVASFREEPQRSVAAYDFDPATGEAVLPLAARVPGNESALLVGTLSLQRLHERMEALVGSGGTHVMIIDAGGTPVTSNVPLAGDTGLVASARDDGAWRYTHSGIERLYVAAPLAASGGASEGRIIVGEPTSGLEAAARQDLQQKGALLLGILLVAALVASVVADHVFRRPARRMLVAVREMEAGALDVAVPRGDMPREWQEFGEALQNMGASIARMERDRQALLNHVAHQLRTPLTPLFLRLELARNAVERGDQEGATRSLDAMVRPLRDLAGKAQKLDALGGLLLGTKVPDVRPVEAWAVLQEVQQQVTPDAEEKGVQVTVRAGADVVLRGDRALVAMALGELAGNALAVSPQGAAVSLEAATAPDGTRLIVRDEGPGLPAASLERLLAPVWAWDAPGDRRGLGIGILIARLVADVHGGRLEGGHNPEGPGAWFGIWIPSE